MSEAKFIASPIKRVRDLPSAGNIAWPEDYLAMFARGLTVNKPIESLTIIASPRMTKERFQELLDRIAIVL